MTYRLHLPVRSVPAVLAAALAAVLVASTGPAAPPAQAGGIPGPLRCFAQDVTIVGTSGDDDITGTEGPDVVWLGAGEDTFVGFGGDDLVCAGKGDDDIDTGEGNDKVDARFGTVRTGPGDDYVRAEKTVNVHTGSGRDRVDAGGTGRVHLGAGRDRVSVHDGRPDVNAGAGDDRLQLFWADYLSEGDKFAGAHLHGGPGRDSLWWVMDWAVRVDARVRKVSSPGRWATWQSIHEIHGSGYADVMIGSKRHDHFFGMYGKDRLRGRGGNDTLLGGGAKDVVDGGAGTDTCRGEVKKRCEKRP